MAKPSNISSITGISLFPNHSSSEKFFFKHEYMPQTLKRRRGGRVSPSSGPAIFFFLPIIIGPKLKTPAAAPAIAGAAAAFYGQRAVIAVPVRF